MSTAKNIVAATQKLSSSAGSTEGPPETLAHQPNVGPNADAAEALRYCPVCSTLLEQHRCKLRCTVCGYYMSCSDCY